MRYISSFCEGRGSNYSRHISKPKREPKILWKNISLFGLGNLSVRQAVQYVQNHPNYDSNKRSFNNHLTRLKWRCHFIQKFEVECTYETQCVNRGYETLEYESNPKFLEAWKKGKTGFPLS